MQPSVLWRPYALVDFPQVRMFDIQTAIICDYIIFQIPVCNLAFPPVTKISFIPSALEKLYKLQ